MDKALNRELNQPTLNVVPQSFTPRPEQFQKPVTQDLRNNQARWAWGYATGRINHLEIQLHRAPNKRDPEWMHMMYDERGNELGIGFNQPKIDALLVEAIKKAKTARTVMMNNISEWAGSLDEEEMNAALPYIWQSFVAPDEEQDAPESAEPDGEEALVEEVVPVQVLTRPDVDFDNMPKSEVVAPQQLKLGDILGKIEQDNKS